MLIAKEHPLLLTFLFTLALVLPFILFAFTLFAFAFFLFIFLFVLLNVLLAVKLITVIRNLSYSGG